jgi:hypothetical protein
MSLIEPSESYRAKNDELVQLDTYHGIKCLKPCSFWE